MHELSITQSILNTVLKHAVMNGVHKILSIRLQISKLSELEDEWIQRYFDYLSQGTAAEGAILKIEHMPVFVKCEGCTHSYETELTDIDNIACPFCGEKKATLVPERKYTIKDMEAI